MMVAGECSLPVVISTLKPFIVFSHPCPAEEASDRAALVGTWCPARVNPPHRVVAMWVSRGRGKPGLLQTVHQFIFDGGKE